MVFSIEEDTSKNENIIENNGTVITYIKGDDNTSNLGYSELNPDKKDATNKINSINNYNFNTKFSEFRVNNIEGAGKKNLLINEVDDDKNENKENQSNNILKKKSQIKTLIRNINIEDNKY